MTFYEMLKDKPSFKRYCARQSTRPIPKPKRFRVPIPKPLGPLSVLGEYATCDPATMRLITARLQKHGNEYTSVIKHDPLEQQNALLRQLAA